MKKYNLSFFLIITLVLSINTLKAQTPTPKDCSVELWATVQVSPPTVTLNWLPNVGTTNYAIARKPKNSSVWTTLSATNPSSTTQYIDNTVSLGTHYEYRVTRSAATGTTNYTGYGYLNSGIQIPEVENRGKLILLITDNFSVSLAPEIKRLQDDLEGDGWEVLTSYVSTATAVPAIKTQIVNTYNLDPSNTKALFLLGHIPVPYSGNLYPDGHTDHYGAWPADVYYGDINGTWTDVSVTSNTISPARTQNIPGDGKFDQFTIPSAVELQVGRVDLYGMTSFTASETQLLKNYLDKDHNYRKKVFTTVKRAVIDDNFGSFFPAGESFASSGFKNFGPLVTPTNVVQTDYFTTMTGNSYQWSYGCGGGSFTSAGGIGSTTNFASSNLQGVFTMMFGSYFGDWDITNNFLRAPLCQGQTLTNAWAGRPNWMFHHMAMGENIGYCAQLTQNNVSTYYASPYGGGITNAVHIALMGDPSLRNDIVSPVSNVVATKVGNNCAISWSASTETTLVGYNIYMKNDTNKTYTKINTVPVAGTTYTDLCLQYPGVYKYMVRALKLETTPSGTYYNMSEGIADTALNSSYLAVTSQFTNTPIGTTYMFNNNSINATSYLWTFGNGATSTNTNPSTTYTANGSYTVTLIGYNSCASDTSTAVINILTVGLNKLNATNSTFDIYPNPANTSILFSSQGVCESCSITIYNSAGELVYQQQSVSDNLKINVADLKKGIYLVKLTDKLNNSVSKKLIID
ncbi:MAG: T9SS type A sorting domain-containing protein [Bacteroidota bacterium]|nr:T9SS type A sorting domain-containing protein [Bacteroidota bacterium]